MKNPVRILIALLLLAACITAAAPAPISTKTGFQDGPAPVPLCDPRVKKC